MQLTDIELAEQRLTLHHYGAAFWRDERWLMLSDLHLGKAAHFRKVGMAMPDGHDEGTLERIDQLITLFDPLRLVMVGDLFHSDHNNSWEKFHVWCIRQKIELHLVLGNHDGISPDLYEKAGLVVHSSKLEQAPFTFVHEPPAAKELSTMHFICGHIHPGFALVGKGRQKISLPCFVFGDHVSLLPAFGLSTGLFRITPKRSDRVYVLTPRSVMAVPNWKV